ncbi:MAG TPA: YdcF family protein [Candidatus Acidoferrum sp.]|nr:YdcF family protein [Candidatus Acidoferrum sp.]
MLPFLVATILPSQQQRKPHLWLWFSCFIFFAGFTTFLNLGRWLILEDPLEHASAIAVLSGSMPSRALEAARIYRDGYAPEVWLTHSTEPGRTLAKLSVPFSAEDTYDKLILIREGVPESAIRILDPPILNTEDEINTIGQAVRAQPDRKVIIVTSNVHTRRTKALWNRLSAKQGRAIVRGLSDDSFDAARWWQSTTDVLDVVREVLGLLNVWAGLPLRPAR